MRFVHELEPEPTALHAARQAVERWCFSQFMDPESLVIVANELCSNAIRHGSGAVLLRASSSPRWVSVSVEQRGKVALLAPAHAHASDLRVSGHGMQLVDALAESWGWQTTEARTVLWARLARRDQ